MKFLNQAIIATALFTAAAAPASAMVSSSIQGDVISAVGANSNVRVQVTGNTVTLSGYAEDAYAILAAERAAANAEGVDRVINNLFRTN